MMTVAVELLTVNRGAVRSRGFEHRKERIVSSADTLVMSDLLIEQLGQDDGDEEMLAVMFAVLLMGSVGEEMTAVFGESEKAAMPAGDEMGVMRTGPEMAVVPVGHEIAAIPAAHEMAAVSAVCTNGVLV